MIDIGWTYVKNKPELEVVENLFFKPQKVSEIYDDNYSMFRRCPANTSFLKSLWVIRSPADIRIKYNRDTHTYDISGVKQDFVDNFFDGRLNDFDKEKGNPLISLITNLSPNHLDHHKNLKEYYNSKLNNFKNKATNS